MENTEVTHVKGDSSGKKSLGKQDCCSSSCVLLVEQPKGCRLLCTRSVQGTDAGKKNRTPGDLGQCIFSLGKERKLAHRSTLTKRERMSLRKSSGVSCSLALSCCHPWLMLERSKIQFARIAEEPGGSRKYKSVRKNNSYCADIV